MSAKQDRLNLDAVIEALTPEQRNNLEDRAELLGFPRGVWTALPADVTVAVSWATTAVANGLRVHYPEWDWGRCLEEAEVSLLSDAYADQLTARPKSVRSTYARWQKAVERRPDD